MHALLRTAIVGLVGLAPVTSFGQTSKQQALKVGSDLRWVNANCYAAKIDYSATVRMMEDAGLKDPFDPNGPFQSYLESHDKFLDDGAKSAGLQLMCQSLLDRYRSTGFVAPRSKEDLASVNRIRSSEGVQPIEPLQ